MSKVFVLALDALEYSLVVKWQLKHLMQKKFGRFKSIVNEKAGVPLSPEVWGSFITGREQQIGSWHVYNRFFEFLRKKTPLKWVKGKRRYTLRLGVKPGYIDRKYIKGATIFDVIPKSIAIEVPTYNLDTSKLLGLLEVHFGEGFRAFEAGCRRMYGETVDEIFKKINDDWDLFVAWIGIADAFGHAFIRDTKKMRRLYQKLNLLAYNISRRIPSNALLLIISDHGMQLMSDGTGQHTNYAFYSFNIEVGWQPTRMTDFYRFIVTEVKS